jgi:hypothetical protein
MSLITRHAAEGVLRGIRESGASELLRAKGTTLFLLRMLYDANALSDFQLDEALSAAIINDAKTTVKYMRRAGGYADHAGAGPEYLAYAIESNRLSLRERRQIRRCLDHEKTLEEFVAHYRNPKLIIDLKNSLLES